MATLSGKISGSLSKRDGEGGHAGVCGNCGTSGFCRRRAFSDQAWSALLLWNEINPSAVDQPICYQCYEEMRDILIDRNEEMAQVMPAAEELTRIRHQAEHRSKEAS